MNKSAELKLQLLTSKHSQYNKFYLQIKDKYTDDRRLFQNMYENLVEAVYFMGGVENNFVWVAFNEQFNKDLEQMDEIITRFEEMEELKGAL